MAVTAHVYQIYINADADRVWQAITDSEWRRQYFHGTSFVAPPEVGQPYRTVKSDGGDASDGVIEEMTPPGDGPGRFVHTWHVLYDAAMAEEPPSRVEWTVEQVGPQLTRVRLLHGDLAFSPLTWANVKDGWVWILDGMKTLLETGRPLPAAEVETPVSDNPTGDWHRRQGIEANNSVWDLLAKPDRTPEDDEDLLRRAYTSAYHWQRATGTGPANEIRARYMIARALHATHQPERALVTAEGALALCREHGIADFDLAYAYEAQARALWALGRTPDGDAAMAAARAVPIADPEDLAIVEKDFADLPHYG